MYGAVCKLTCPTAAAPPPPPPAASRAAFLGGGAATESRERFRGSMSQGGVIFFILRVFTYGTGTITHPDRNTQDENAGQRRATQGNARRASRTNAAETTPANQKPTPRIPNTTRNHQRPKTETYAPTASRSHRNHHPRPTSTTPSKPTKPAKDHPGSYPSPPSAPDAYKQRPSTSRHHSVWSVCPVLSRISQYVRQPDERVGTPRP